MAVPTLRRGQRAAARVGSRRRRDVTAAGRAVAPPRQPGAARGACSRRPPPRPSNGRAGQRRARRADRRAVRDLRAVRHPARARRLHRQPGRVLRRHRRRRLRHDVPRAAVLAAGGDRALQPELRLGRAARLAARVAPQAPDRPQAALARRRGRTSCASSSAAGSHRERAQPRAVRADPGVAARDGRLHGRLHPAQRRAVEPLADVRADLPRPVPRGARRPAASRCRTPTRTCSRSSRCSRASAS